MRWVVTWLSRIVGISAVVVQSLGATPAAGYGTQVLENNWTICTRQTQKREREQRISYRLLRAISLAESGRWHPDTGEISAWPWTVMAQGKGRFFDNKQASVSWVRKLQAKGVTNIDVGCMQVNLFHHGHQFPSLEHAFDPAQNTAYAAKFLRKKFNAARSWTVAAGHYHSTDPIKNTPYRRKVLQFWHGSSRNLKQQAKADTSKQKRTVASRKRSSRHDLKLLHLKSKQQNVAFDNKRMKMLNANFRRTLAGTPSPNPDIQPTNRAPALAQNQTPVQPTRYQSKRSLKTIIRRNGNGRRGTFAQRLRTQLQRWHRTRASRARRVDG